MHFPRIAIAAIIMIIAVPAWAQMPGQCMSVRWWGWHGSALDSSPAVTVVRNGLSGTLGDDSAWAAASALRDSLLGGDRDVLESALAQLIVNERIASRTVSRNAAGWYRDISGRATPIVSALSPLVQGPFRMAALGAIRDTLTPEEESQVFLAACDAVIRLSGVSEHKQMLMFTTARYLGLWVYEEAATLEYATKLIRGPLRIAMDSLEQLTIQRLPLEPSLRILQHEPRPDH